VSTTYRTAQGDMLDELCERLYGQQSGAVELVLAANPGLAELGPVLPVDTVIEFPDLPKPATELQPIRLWG
jgi:phage tail protein X